MFIATHTVSCCAPAERDVRSIYIPLLTERNTQEDQGYKHVAPSEQELQYQIKLLPLAAIPATLCLHVVLITKTDRQRNRWCFS